MVTLLECRLLHEALSVLKLLDPKLLEAAILGEAVFNQEGTLDFLAVGCVDEDTRNQLVHGYPVHPVKRVPFVSHILLTLLLPS